MEFAPLLHPSIPPHRGFGAVGGEEGSIAITWRGAAVAELRHFALRRARAVAGDAPLTADDPGMPLYWHADDAHGRAVLPITGTCLCRACDEHHIVFDIVVALGTVAESRCTLEITSNDGELSYTASLTLRVISDEGWRVMAHPQHGELEFCGLWPEDVFPLERGARKRYTDCVLARDSAAIRIPHHHAETDDKYRLVMRAADRLLWVGEEVNPCITLLEGEAEAGICAYMWDAHVGIRACGAEATRILPRDWQCSAAWMLHFIGKEEGDALLAASVRGEAGPAADVPVVVDGRNLFDTAIGDTAGSDAWPWTAVPDIADDPAVRLLRAAPRTDGDAWTLRIEHSRYACSHWEATTLGPAFGGAPFPAGMALRVTADVRVAGTRGTARLRMRRHLAGAPDLFNPRAWEHAEGTACSAGSARLECTFPATHREIDRVHVILEFAGSGTADFADLLIERIV